MSVFETLKDTFSKNKEISWMFDLDLIHDTSQRIYLKEMSINSISNYIGRTMSTAKFKFKNGDNIVKSRWDYVLNVKPNSDMSASFFWQKFFNELIKNNRVLAILTDDDQLLIADDFDRKEYAVYEDYFYDVTIKDYTFERRFKMSEVLYLEYNNEELETFTNGLFDDYGELFGRMIEVAMRNNQIRASVAVETTGTANDEKQKNGKTLTENLQNFIDKIYKSFKTNTVAIVPKMKGFDYEEYTNKMGVSNQSLEDLEKMKKSLVDDIARAIGIPPALVRGEMADLESNMKAFRKFCIVPLINKLEDEVNVKIIEKEDFMRGSRIEVKGIMPRDPVESATQIDKLVSSSTFLVDEVREEFEYDPLPNGEGKERIRTKNYELVKGGEEINDSED